MSNHRRATTRASHQGHPHPSAGTVWGLPSEAKRSGSLADPSTHSAARPTCRIPRPPSPIPTHAKPKNETEFRFPHPAPRRGRRADASKRRNPRQHCLSATPPRRKTQSPERCFWSLCPFSEYPFPARSPRVRRRTGNKKAAQPVRDLVVPHGEDPARSSSAVKTL